MSCGALLLWCIVFWIVLVALVFMVATGDYDFGWLVPFSVERG